MLVHSLSQALLAAVVVEHERGGDLGAMCDLPDGDDVEAAVGKERERAVADVGAGCLIWIADHAFRVLNTGSVCKLSAGTGLAGSKVGAGDHFAGLGASRVTVTPTHERFARPA